MTLNSLLRLDFRMKAKISKLNVTRDSQTTINARAECHVISYNEWRTHAYHSRDNGTQMEAPKTGVLQSPF